MKICTQMLVFVCVMVPCIVGPPVQTNETEDEKDGKANEKREMEMELQLEYENYLKQVVEVLEKDAPFNDKLQKASLEDIRSGKIGRELNFVDRNIRSKLDELKRIEIDRLTSLAKREYELSNGIDRKRLSMPLHLDVRNPHTFEVRDLERLMKQTTRDLEDIDRRRREEFKEYEMQKEHRRREELKKMDEEHRKKAQQEFDEQMQKRKEHAPLHHPGSKPQLEKVWHDEDKMEYQDFDPKSFFKMHDLNDDNQWDAEEIEALFYKETEAVQQKNPANAQMDPVERQEEMKRMREHVVNETDKNMDGLISYQEFIDMTKKQEFQQDPGWQGLDEQQIYSQQEFEEYERQLQAGMIPPGGMPIYNPDVHPEVVLQQQGIPPPGYYQQPDYGGHQQGQHHGAPQYQQQQYQQQPPHYQQQPPHYQQQPPQYQQQPPQYQQQVPQYQQQQQQQPPQQQQPQQQQQQPPQQQQQPPQQQQQPPQQQQQPPQQQQQQQQPPQQQQPHNAVPAPSGNAAQQPPSNQLPPQSENAIPQKQQPLKTSSN